MTVPTRPGRRIAIHASPASASMSRARISSTLSSGIRRVTVFVAGSIAQSSSGRAPQTRPPAKASGMPPPVSMSATTCGFGPLIRWTGVRSPETQTEPAPATAVHVRVLVDVDRHGPGCFAGRAIDQGDLAGLQERPQARILGRQPADRAGGDAADLAQFALSTTAMCSPTPPVSNRPT